MERVLVIQTAFLGDAILGTALLERIHADYPDAAIDYLVRKGNEHLFIGHPFIRETLTFDKSRKFLELLRLLKVIRSRRYKAVINAQRFASSGLLTGFSGAKRRVGYVQNPLSFLFTDKIPHRLSSGQVDSGHETERLLDLYRPFGLTVRSLPRIYPTPEDVEAVSGYAETTYITVAPASVWFTKQWPEKRWAEFIAQVPKGIQIHLIGGPGDIALCQRIAQQSGREAHLQCGRLSLLQTAALMQSAVMNYANDSAPVHMASAVGAKVCAVFCSTVPEFGFTPLTEGSQVVETKERLDCRPCGLHGHRACPKGHFKCADIEVERLMIPLSS
jgi:ADP-heptose:LPS heptosyltransferase